MCGLVGFVSKGSQYDPFALVSGMADALTHRGPDDAGVWVDRDIGLALGHRRLSVLDLSNAGHQPMASPSGRFILAFNGEIYNHGALRAGLEAQGGAPMWRGHSDTETLLACIEAWGVVRSLKASVGMFAIALWDRERRELVLARDRMGEKPLYWGWQGDRLFFGSELGALKANPLFRSEIDRGSLALFLRRGYVPAPYSIYRDVRKLPPGHVLTIPLDDGTGSVSEPYWQFNKAVEAGRLDPIRGNDREATDLLEAQISESLRGQMLADVPVGAFFSGGVDSSTIVALMQAQSARPVKTFTIGFEGSSYDEAAYASVVARHLGTDHTELLISARDALDVIPDLPSIYSEPLSADSQIPFFLISRLARQHVTVALSGDGGDELFGGYNRYLAARRIWGMMRQVPMPLRRAATSLLRSLSPAGWDRLFDRLSLVLPKRLRLAIPGTKAQKLADVLQLSSEQDYFSRLTSHWPEPLTVVRCAAEPPTLLTDPDAWPGADCFEHWMMAMDAQTFLPDEVLAKVDRAAMANSLETRVPLLDHRIVELAWRLPLSMKIRDGEGKWLLRQVLYRHVPRNLVERPKMGFGIPIDRWLRGPLRDWAEDLLDERRMAAEGFFTVSEVRKKWTEHASGRFNWQYQLWPILMFQAWLRAGG